MTKQKELDSNPKAIQQRELRQIQKYTIQQIHD